MMKTLGNCVLLIAGGLFCFMIVSGRVQTRPAPEQGCLSRSEPYQLTEVPTALIVFEQGAHHSEGNEAGDTERPTFVVRNVPAELTEVEGGAEMPLDSGTTLSEWL